MEKFKKTISLLFMGALMSGFLLTSCDDESDDPVLPPIGGYNSSDEVAAANLVSKFSFENSPADAKNTVQGGTPVNATFGAGAKGQAFMGTQSESDGFIHYSSTGAAIKDMQSFTVSMWINTANQADGASSVFMLSHENNWIGNLFLLQESGVVGQDSIRFKFKFDSWGNNVTWKEQWIEFGGKNKITGISNRWAHLAFTYDATSSKFNVYVDGVKKVMPDNVTNRYNNDPAAGGGPLGPAKFANADKFIIGGYQSHMGGTPDAWMKTFKGGLDELRIYNKALADADIKALFDLEKAGR